METNTTKCPLCGRDAEMQTTTSAYCTSDECEVLTFNPEETVLIAPDPRRPWRSIL